VRTSARIVQTIALLLTLALALVPGERARADVAPPDAPPGANPVPVWQPTQVRMVSETVLLDVQRSTPPGSQGRAKVRGEFVLRNLGALEERFAVRLPLTFWDGRSDGFRLFPER